MEILSRNNNITSTNKSGNNISIAILSNIHTPKIKFKNLNDLTTFLNHYLENVNANMPTTLIDNQNKRVIETKRLYIKITNRFLRYRDILNFFAFIYDKNFNPFELENIASDNILIILPFISIKCTRKSSGVNQADNYLFTYH